MKLTSIFLFTLGAALFAAAFLQRPSETIPSKAGPLSVAEVEEDEGHRPALPDEALKFRLLQLQDENKQIPADGLLKGKAHLEVMKRELVRRAVARGGDETEALTTAGLQPGDWISVGPGNIGGRIRAIAIDPTNANNIWVGSVGGGIWRTTNAGSSWAPVNDFLADLAISSIVINPTNPNIMYAGTGESFTLATNEGQPLTPDGLRGLGIFKSTDAGLTWNQLAKTNPADLTICPTAGTTCAWSYVNRLAISPDGATILAATYNGIWRTTDGGTSWTQSPSVTGSFSDIDFDPTNSQKAIASGTNFSAYSTDGGQTWAGATFSPALNAASTGRIEVAYAPSSTGTVFASVNTGGGQIYRSANGGQSFNAVQSGSNYLGTQGNYGNIIWVDPIDPNVVIVGGIDLWRSTNASTGNPINLTQISKWQCAPNGGGSSCSGISAHADQHMIMAVPGFNNTTNKRAYFSNDGGIYRTDDVLNVSQTSGWVDMNNSLFVTQFYSGTVTAGDALIGGTQDNGNVIANPDASLDPPYNALTWTTPIGAGGDGGYVAADPLDPKYVYTEYVNLQIARSSDAGAHFSQIYCNPGSVNATTQQCNSSTGITDVANGANFIAPFIVDPSNGNRMLAGGLSLWQSTNVKSSIPTWTAIKSPLSDGATPPNNVPISAIAIAPNNPDLVVVGHNGGQIFLSSNGTSASPTWTESDGTLPKRFVTRLVIDSTRNPNWIYATFGGFSPDNVYVTKNLGTSWTDITGTGATGLPDVPVRTLLVNTYIPNYIYVGTEVGAFASQDAGATWQLPQGGPANVSVEELFEQTHHILAATHGRGMYTDPNALAGPATDTWTTSNASGAWLNSAQWGSSGHFPGVTNNPSATANGATDDLAVFGAMNSNINFFNPVYILMQNASSTGVNNFTGANGAITLGAIQTSSSLNTRFRLSTGAATPGTITLTGRTVDGVDNTILANDSAQTFDIGGDGNGSIQLFLGNTTDNVIQANSSAVMTISASISGAGRQIEKTGPGELILNGFNTYSGGTIITGGTIGFASSDITLGSVTAPLTINGGTLDMTGTSLTVGALNGTGGTITNSTSSDSILTFGNGNANGSYSGIVADSIPGSDRVGLTKIGTGTQILSGASAFSDQTLVNAGTLLVYNTSGSAGGTFRVLLPANVGATFGGGTIDGSGGLTCALTLQGLSSDASPCQISPGSATGPTGILRVGSFSGGGILNIDLAGTNPGTSYDQFLVTGSGNFFGSVRVRFANSFQNSVQSTDVFDFLKIGSGTLNVGSIDNRNTSGRLNVFGIQGSFAVQVVDSGKTFRLTDFQVGSVTFQSWAAAHNLTGVNASATADPDGDGLSNLAEYAFGRDPNVPDGGAIAQTQIVSVGGTNYLGLTYARPAGPNADTDITYTPQRTTDLTVQWSSADVVVQSITPGPGTLETVIVRSTHPMNTVPKEFLRINVSKP